MIILCKDKVIKVINALKGNYQQVNRYIFVAIIIKHVILTKDLNITLF